MLMTSKDLLPYLTRHGNNDDWRFESVDEAMRIASSETAEHIGEYDNLIDMSFRRRSTEWLGVKDYSDFQKVIASGWIDGINRIYQALGGLELDEIEPVCIKRKRHRSDQGDELDIHRVLSGDLDRAWDATRRQARSHVGGTIELAIDVGIHFRQHADELFWRSAALIVLADKLTAAGYNVGIRAVHKLHRPNSLVESRHVSIDIKLPQDQLNVESTAIAIALAGYSRLLMCGMANVSAGKIEIGYGKPCNVDADKAQGSIFCPRAITNESSARQWLIDTVAALKVPATQ